MVTDLNVIAEALQNGESEPDLVVGLHDRRNTLTEPAFVGRGQELAALEVQLKRTQEGQGGLVLLEAESGGGKSRLLSEFALRGAQQGVWILRGLGLDQAAQRCCRHEGAAFSQTFDHIHSFIRQRPGH